MMRIITGKARGTKLFSLEGLNTRPTSERTKEAVFSMIQLEIQEGRVLDLFAGSGQMGLEALSRGANEAVFVDNSKQAVDIIKKNVVKTHFENNSYVVLSGYAEYLRNVKGGKRFDLVFLDPPYASGFLTDALSKLCEYDLLNDNAIVVCESGNEDVLNNDPLVAERFEIKRQAKYGIACISIIRYRKEESNG